MKFALQQSIMDDTAEVLLIYSGGLDSTTLLYDLLSSGRRVYALSIDYGQRHKREIAAAATICARRMVRHNVLDISSVAPFLKGNALTDPKVEVPEGYYADGNMQLTVVPNRNMVLLSLALGVAISEGLSVVAYAAHRGDHSVYPDCRPEFVRAIQSVASVCHYSPIEFLAPYLTLSKSEIVQQGYRLGVPFAETWSCYRGDAMHCGNCGTCLERREAFQLAGINDPTSYEAGQCQ